MEGIESEWKERKAGIRQGCPLSPYLFIIIMSCLFLDIHKHDALNMAPFRVQGMQHDQVLYADDTICISEDDEAMERLLAAIETQGKEYGLRLNKHKCEYIIFGDTRSIKFANGDPVPRKKRRQRLGCKHQ